MWSKQYLPEYIVAAKPHNLLKPSMKNSLSLETENMNLFVHINKPVLQDWNPRSAILLWFKKLEQRKKETQKARTQPYFRHNFEEAKGGDSMELELETEESSESSQEKTKSFGI